MNIKLAKKYFSLGVIKGFKVVRDPMASGWLLELRLSSGTVETLETAVGSVKSFSSLDTLVGQVASITGGEVKSLDLSIG